MNSVKRLIIGLVIMIGAMEIIFAAGARLSSQRDDIVVELYTTDGKRPVVIVPAGQTVNFDAGAFIGFDGLKWIDYGRTYEVIFTDVEYKKNRIEGIEGWRYWTFIEKQGVVEIGAPNIFTPPYGRLKGKLIKEVNYPINTDISSTDTPE